MRKEIILEDAYSQLEDWREAYVEKLTTEFPKAMVLPIGHTIDLTRRGQHVWIVVNKRDLEDVRVVTWTRSVLIPIGIVFAIIGGIFLFSLIMSCWSYFSSYFYSYYCSYGSYCYYPRSFPYFYVIPYIPFLLFFFGLAIGLLKTNKTREMQAMALRIARETWLNFSRKVESTILTRPEQSPPKNRVTLSPDDSDLVFGSYCMYCGTHVDKSGAKFCEHCGKSLLY